MDRQVARVNGSLSKAEIRREVGPITLGDELGGWGSRFGIPTSGHLKVTVR
jgi:hypothetical protein